MKKVITYGTFDLFHIGHRNILERAKALGDHLIVAVTSENFDLERGKLNVQDSLLKRIENVRQSGLADEIIVEEYLGQKVNDILKYGVDVFVIGSDWTGQFDYLKKYCEVVYLERTKDISSTQLRNEGHIFRIGIITDRKDDAAIVSESKFVSGLDTVGVYTTDGAGAIEPSGQIKTVPGGSDFAEKYELSKIYESPVALIEDTEIVFVHTAIPDRYLYAKQVLQHGRHLILDFPVANRSQMADLYEIASAGGLSIRVRVPLAYLRTFHQLVWLLHSGVIGDVQRIAYSVPDADNAADGAAIILFAANRLSGGAKIEPVESDKEGMTITGTAGRIVIPGKWQSMSYFRVESADMDAPKHYSFNIEGSGFRYLLSVMLSAIKENRPESGMFTPDEALTVIEKLEKAGMLS
ncbi:MAG: adenylyltransferase/cytidyltransferase family protein [Clostridiales Family XIII bacterium]|nr:adenylyltransferase/cytidyltransferase family protein [Clostridiales Family XIII bacterium]